MRNLSKMKIWIARVVVLTLIISSIPFHNFIVSANNEAMSSASGKIVNKDNSKLKSDKQEEIMELRTETSKTYLNEDGSHTTEIYQTPIHFKDSDNNWANIDNMLKESKDKKFIENNENTFKTKFNKSDTTPHDVVLEEDSKRIEYGLQSIKMQAEQIDVNSEDSNVKVENNAITFENLSEDMHLKYSIGSDRVKEDIVYTSRPKDGFPESFTYKLEVNDLEVKVEENVIYLLDSKTKEKLYFIEAPYMYDSFVPEGFKSNDKINAVPEQAISRDLSLDYKLEDGQHILILTPSQDWLNDEKRIFPVTIDPTIVRIKGSSLVQDTNLRSGFPTQTGGNDTELGMGLYQNSTSTNVIRTLLKFDLSSIPRHVTVTNADLNLWMASVYKDTPITISAHQMLNSWEENGASWNLRNNSPQQAWTTKGGDYNGTAFDTLGGISNLLDLSFNLKWKLPNAMVNNWITSPTNNHGILLKSTSEQTNTYKKFVSSEHPIGEEYQPRLVVTYKTTARLGLEHYWDYATHPLAEGEIYVNIGTLNNIIQYTDLSLTNYADFGFNFRRTYNSKDYEKSGFGYGWSHSGDQKLYVNTNQTNIELKDEDGTVHIFEWNGTKYQKPLGFEGELVKKDSSTYEIQKRDGHTSTFVIKENARDTDIKVAYLTQQRDIHGNTILYTYDSQNQLIKIRTSLGNEVLFSYNNGLIAKAQSNDREISYKYDSRSYLTSTSVKKNDTEFTTTTYNYTNDFLTSIVDPKNNTTSFSYENGFLHTVTEPELEENNPSVTTYELDRSTLTARVKGPQGDETTYKLNDNYVVTGITSADTQTTYTLDANYRILTEQTNVIGEDSYTKNYQYNTYGDLLNWSDSKNEMQTFTYDSAGNILTEIDTAGNKTVNVYDGKNNLISTTTPKGELTEYTYNQLGELTQIKSPSGNVQHFETDYANQQKKTIYTDSENDLSTMTIHDLKGNLLSTVDGKGQTTSYKYNLKNELIEVVDAVGKITKYKYDGNGNLISATNTAGKTMQLEYNSQNKVSKETNALGNATAYNYNANGEISEITKANGNKIEYVENEDSQTRFVKINGTTHFTTKTDGLKKHITNHSLFNQITTYEQTEDGLFKSINFSSPSNTLISYEYGDNRALESILYGADKISYTRDQNTSVKTISLNNSLIAEFSYNSELLPINLKFGNGNSILNNYKTDQATILSQELRLSETNNYNTYNYTYDKNQQITKITDKLGQVEYEYDELNQLIKETYSNGLTIEYDYDPVGNRTLKKQTVNDVTKETTYTYNAANQISSIGLQTVDTDENGNIIKDGTYQYVWNGLDQLVEVKANDGTSIVSYKYDELGRRVFKDNNSLKIYFRYDGDSNRVLFEEDENGSIISAYTYDENGIPLTWTYNGSTYYYLTNYRGDVLAVTDATGQVVAEYTYDAWGNILSQNGQLASVNPYRYAGYRYDTETNLYYLMARYYNASIGNFLSLDPVRGDITNPITMNGYNYANNNPVMNIDPDGEASFSVAVKKVLKSFIRFLFKDFRQNTLTNIALIIGGGSIGAWIARKQALSGFQMINRQPVKKAVQGFIRGGIAAYIYGSILGKAGDFVQRWAGKLYAYEKWFDKTWLGSKIDKGLTAAEQYLLRRL